MSVINSIDLFSGCGGMTVGFKQAGFNTILASDIDVNCFKTFKKNFPETPFINEDISKISKKEFKSLIQNKNVDIISGGPPCQGFSLANKNRNKIKDDPRNALFYEFVRVIKIFQPKVFIMENVKGILSMKKGAVINLIQDEFESAGEGYNVDYKLLLSSDYGVPQTRERVIMLGFRKDLKIFPEFPKPINMKKNISVWDAISDLPQINAGEGDEIQEYASKPLNNFQKKMRVSSRNIHNHVAMKHTQRLIDRFKVIKHGQSLANVPKEYSAVKRGDPNVKSGIIFSQNNKRVFPDMPSPTIAASFQSNYIHPYLNRNFTAREGARLQSFPDNFIFEGMRTKMSWEKGLSQYQQIGNAVPPLLSKVIAKQIRKNLLEGNSKNYKPKVRQKTFDL